MAAGDIGDGLLHDRQLRERLIEAEQDERRRIAVFLHDGPVQSLAGIALMLDAALDAVQGARQEEAERILSSALDRHRQTIRALRDLSFELEPVVLRDQGFVPAVLALAEQLGMAHGVRIDLDLAVADELTDKTHIAVYQILREALEHAVRRGPPTRVRVALALVATGDIEVTIADDGSEERRRGHFASLEERARALNGRVVVDRPDSGGTTIVVWLPAYAARR
jgi:two-component system NarL family sensor kinase